MAALRRLWDRLTRPAPLPWVPSVEATDGIVLHPHDGHVIALACPACGLWRNDPTEHCPGCGL